MTIKLKRTLIILLIMFTGFLSACNVSFDIQLGYKKMTLSVGESVCLDTNYSDMNEEGSVIWTSSNESVATVNNEGLVEALKEGYTYITATFNEHSTKVYVSVIESKTDVRKLSISGTQMIIINETVTLKANIELKNDEYIIWETSNDKVVSVNENGEVKGLTTGLVSVRATLSSDESIYDDITILVRSGNGVQDVIYNYIYTNSYELSSSLDLTSLNEKVTTTVGNVRDAILGVSNYQKSGLSYSQESVGSCVIYKKEVVDGGYKYTVLTNYHVVEDASYVKIYIGNDVDDEFSANILKTDADLDLAIVEFTYKESLPCLSFGKSEDVQNGNFVLAIGNPNGYDYYNSVTFGVVSYVNRTLTGEKSKYVQHDAAINSGNSGGPLLNLDGEIIGINTLKIAKTTVEGMGFAIDLDTIKGFIGE